MRRSRALLALLVVACVLGDTASGDAIVTVRAMRATTIMEIFVEPERVRVELELGLADVDAFANLLPPQLYEHLRREPVDFPERVGPETPDGAARA